METAVLGTIQYKRPFFSNHYFQFQDCGICGKLTCDLCRFPRGTCHICRTKRNSKRNTEEALQALTNRQLCEQLLQLHFDPRKYKVWNKDQLIAQILRRCSITRLRNEGHDEVQSTAEEVQNGRVDVQVSHLPS